MPNEFPSLQPEQEAQQRAARGVALWLAGPCLPHAAAASGVGRHRCTGPAWPERESAEGRPQPAQTLWPKLKQIDIKDS
jgi:hypothetical protein